MFEYCKECHEVFEVRETPKIHEVFKGKHKEQCSNL